MQLICYPDLTTDSKDSVEFDDVQEAMGFNEGKLRFVGSFGEGWLFGIKHLDTRWDWNFSDETHWRIQIKSNFFLSSCGILSILASPTTSRGILIWWSLNNGKGTWKRDFGPKIRVGWIFEVCLSRSKEGNFPPTIMVQRTIDPFKTIVSFTSKGGPWFFYFLRWASEG